MLLAFRIADALSGIVRVRHAASSYPRASKWGRSDNLLAPKVDKYGVYTATLNNRLNSKRTIKMAIRRELLPRHGCALSFLALPNLPSFSLFHQTPRGRAGGYMCNFRPYFLRSG